MRWSDLIPWSRRESGQTRLITMNLQDVAFPNVDYARLTKDGYQANVTVYACIREVATSVAGVPWILMDTGRSAKPGDARSVRRIMSGPVAAKAMASGHPAARKAVTQSEIEDHPLLALLERPNALQGGASFFEADTGYMWLSGNSYIEAAGPTTGPPHELYTMRPDHMKVIVDKVDLVGGYRHEAGGQHEDYEFQQVLHTKFFNPMDPFYGQSPLMAAARALSTDNEAVKWNFSLLRNEGRPSGAFVYNGTFGPGQFEALKAEVNESFSGAPNAGRPMLLEMGQGSLKWEQMGLSPADLHWEGLRKLTKRELAQVLGCPPELVGDGENKTYSNYRESRKSFYMETVLPYLDFKRDELNGWLTIRYGDRLRLDYDRDQIEALQEEQEKLWVRIQQSDWLTVNEARRATGYDDYEPDEKAGPGDRILRSSAEVPLEDLVGGDDDVEVEPVEEEPGDAIPDEGVNDDDEPTGDDEPEEQEDAA